MVTPVTVNCAWGREWPHPFSFVISTLCAPVALTLTLVAREKRGQCANIPECPTNKVSAHAVRASLVEPFTDYSISLVSVCWEAPR